VRQRTGATRLGDDDLRCLRGDAGDLCQPGYRRCDRVGGVVARVRAGGAIGTDALGRHRGDQLLDPPGERVDLGGQGVDLAEQDPGEFAVVVIEPAGQRLDQRGMLGSHLAAGQVRQDVRVALPGDQRLQHVPHRHGVDPGGDRGHLDQGFSELDNRDKKCIWLPGQEPLSLSSWGLPALRVAKVMAALW
jgi:hypothetical protein